MSEELWAAPDQMSIANECANPASQAVRTRVEIAGSHPGGVAVITTPSEALGLAKALTAWAARQRAAVGL